MLFYVEIAQTSPGYAPAHGLLSEHHRTTSSSPILATFTGDALRLATHYSAFYGRRRAMDSVLWPDRKPLTNPQCQQFYNGAAGY